MVILLDKERLCAPDDETAVVLLGGEMPRDERLLPAISGAKFLAAADGGAAQALRLGRTPDLLVGDFDSLGADDVAACQNAGAEMIRLPVMKDETDGEFLLNTLTARGFKRWLVLGALGGRPDMELANIYCAEAAARRGVTCVFAHDNALMLPLWAEDVPCELEIHEFGGHTFSQIALSEQCRHITLAGFLYPLDGPLKRGQTLGLSNVIEGNCARLTLRGGSLLTVIDL